MQDEHLNTSLMCEENHICINCIGENYLKSSVQNEGFLVDCSYCENADIEGVSLSELTNKLDTAFKQHYTRASESSTFHSTPYYWEPDGMPIIEVIMDAAEISEEIAIDIQQILEETYYDHSAAEIGEPTEYHSESLYEIKRPDDKEWQKQWTDFEKSIKTKARFYNKDNEQLLHSIFNDVELLNTHDDRSIVRYIGPKTDLQWLYRARAFQSDDDLRHALEFPNKELGPPPSEFATAGRMNAKGISVFYGAIDRNTAVAEIRPPVGSKVAVAKFNLQRQLKILDLSALTYTTAKGSIFDDMYADRLSKSMFLRKLSQRMTKIVMPNDEHSEYLITQVIADFLASRLDFDGIIFPSAQFKNGLNATMFHHASSVKSMDFPDNTKVIVNLTRWDVDLDEDFAEYRVDRQLPINPRARIPQDEEGYILSALYSHYLENDQRIKSLSIDLNSINIEHIESVQFICKSHSVEHNVSHETGNDFFDF